MRSSLSGAGWGEHTVLLVVTSITSRFQAVIGNGPLSACVRSADLSALYNRLLRNEEDEDWCVSRARLLYVKSYRAGSVAVERTLVHFDSQCEKLLIYVIWLWKCWTSWIFDVGAFKRKWDLSDNSFGSVYKSWDVHTQRPPCTVSLGGDKLQCSRTCRTWLSEEDRVLWQHVDLLVVQEHRVEVRLNWQRLWLHSDQTHITPDIVVWSPLVAMGFRIHESCVQASWSGNSTHWCREWPKLAPNPSS